VSAVRGVRRPAHQTAPRTPPPDGCAASLRHR
jgi:hypothetical protein